MHDTPVYWPKRFDGLISWVYKGLTYCMTGYVQTCLNNNHNGYLKVIVTFTVLFFVLGFDSFLLFFRQLAGAATSRMLGKWTLCSPSQFSRFLEFWNFFLLKIP